MALDHPKLHLTKPYSDEQQDRITATAPGQAGWAVVGSTHHCDECIYWDPSNRSHKRRRCIRFREVQGRSGPTIDARQTICTEFIAKPVKPPPPPPSRREIFFNPESWRHSRNRYGNLIRSILGTPYVVVVFQSKRHVGRWTWVVHHSDDTGDPIFSSHSFETRAEAMVDLWERQVASMTVDHSIYDIPPAQTSTAAPNSSTSEPNPNPV
jgi:hypothetical protein